ncbi:MAG: dihydroxyacetone kinase subunit DhaK [Treponema sp.]|jgi:dihydroxyacetone kinase-like protein|nr:dihydroxyacetone kinase subunit DhaK [Treponema sp.]
MLFLGYDENERKKVLGRSLKGMCAAEPGAFQEIITPYNYTLYRNDIEENRVAVIISGGGSYGPLFMGFVGKGLADVACEGDFDCAPSAYALYHIAKIVHRAKGILFITNNYIGDFLNNDMAQELLQTENIDSRVCYVTDDMFSASGEPEANRGGLCGVGVITKIASAAANTGMDLDGVYAVTRKAIERMRSVTVQYCEEKNVLEFGAGFSGEEPKLVLPYNGVDDMARQIYTCAMDELSVYFPKEVFFTINRMRLLAYIEGFVITDSLKTCFEEADYKVAGCAVGAYFDAFSGSGCIATILALDEELAKYLPVVRGYDFTI